MIFATKKKRDAREMRSKREVRSYEKDDHQGGADDVGLKLSSTRLRSDRSITPGGVLLEYLSTKMSILERFYQSWTSSQ